VHKVLDTSTFLLVTLPKIRRFKKKITDRLSNLTELWQRVCSLTFLAHVIGISVNHAFAASKLSSSKAVASPRGGHVHPTFATGRS